MALVCILQGLIQRGDLSLEFFSLGSIKSLLLTERDHVSFEVADPVNHLSLIPPDGLIGLDFGLTLGKEGFSL
jgi:hypothetical protein